MAVEDKRKESGCVGRSILKISGPDKWQRDTSLPPFHTTPWKGGGLEELLLSCGLAPLSFCCLAQGEIIRKLLLPPSCHPAQSFGIASTFARFFFGINGAWSPGPPRCVHLSLLFTCLSRWIPEDDFVPVIDTPNKHTHRPGRKQGVWMFTAKTTD